MSAPIVSPREIRARLSTELATPSRFLYTALLLVAIAGSSVVAGLLLTETGLPSRTRVAFAVLLLIGLAWTVFAAWVLIRRRVLFLQHRVVSGWMAVLFSGAFTLGCAYMMATSNDARMWLAAAFTGVVMLVFGVMLLINARRRVTELSHRRAEIEQLLQANRVAP